MCHPINEQPPIVVRVGGFLEPTEIDKNYTGSAA